MDIHKCNHLLSAYYRTRVENSSSLLEQLALISLTQLMNW